MLNIKKSSEQTETEDDSPYSDHSFFLNFRIGVQEDAGSEEKIEFIVELMRAAAELAASDYKDVTLDVSSYSGSTAPVSIPLVRARQC